MEFISLSLVVSVNQDQRRAFSGLSQEVSGGIQNVRADVTGYFDLNKQNRKLLRRNRQLELSVIEMKNQIDRLRFRAPLSRDFTILPDSTDPPGGYDFIGCRVVNHTVHLNYNYITIDRGTLHGIESGMGVISSEGIVGMIVSVSPHYSVGISALNQSFNLSTRLQRSRNLGTLTWNGKDPAIASLNYIPQTTDLRVGDLVVTSGFSTIFPEGFLAGEVVGFDKESHEGFYNIDVKLATDFRAIDHLYVVNHKYRKEIDSLEKISSLQ